MRIRWLGNTGLQVSEICFGTASFGGVGHFKHTGTMNQAEADHVVSIALDAGINFFNTAEMYSDGQAGPVDRTGAPISIFQAADASLLKFLRRRLKKRGLNRKKEGRTFASGHRMGCCAGY